MIEARYNRISGRSLERLAALSDGVFAVAMTLLVLDIHLPSIETIHSEKALLQALAALTPKLIPYMMSFMTLGIFWVGQQTHFSYFTQSNRHLTWINLAFLFVVTLTPLSTGLLAEFITYRTALVIYWLNILALGVLIYASWSYAACTNLLVPEAHAETEGMVKKRIVIAQSLYAFGALLCVFNTYWSIAFIVAVQLNYAIAPRFSVRVQPVSEKRL